MGGPAEAEEAPGEEHAETEAVAAKGESAAGKGCAHEADGRNADETRCPNKEQDADLRGWLQESARQGKVAKDRAWASECLREVFASVGAGPAYRDCDKSTPNVCCP